MLSINIKNDWIPIINYQNYFIELDEEGNQTMQFDIPLGDTYYKLHAEMQIKDEYNLWLIKQINQLKTYATITCYINMDAWKSGYYLKSAEDVKLQTKTITDALNYIKPSGWTISNGNVRDIKRTLDLEKCTSYDLLMRAKVVYDVQYDIDALNKVITVVDPYEVIDLGVYVTPELNLKSSNFKGDGNNVVTRLYCYGADDLTFADINNGKPYVEDTSYKGTPICASWTDGRYTNMESLLADGKKKLAEMSVPSGAYTIDVVDLQAIDEKYKNLEMRLRSTVHCIINPERKIDVVHRIVKKRIYPDMPALNKIILSNQPRTLEKEWNALKENVDSVRKDGYKRETEIRQTNKDITLVAKETEENTKGIKSVEQKITPEQMLITVAESINKGNKLNTMQVIIDLLGLTIKNGGLKVYDNNNKLVLYVDEKTKKLTFNGSVSASSIIGSSISNGLNFHVDANGNMQCTNAKISGHIDATSGTFSGDIVGGSISGDTTINVGTDLSVGNNAYIGNYEDRDARKNIYFNDSFSVSSRNDFIIFGVASETFFQKGTISISRLGSVYVKGHSFIRMQIGESEHSQFIEIGDKVIYMSSQPLITSDARLKTEISDIDASSMIDEIDIKSFIYKSGGAVQLGVIAQDLSESKYCDYLLSTDREGYYAVNHNAINMALVQKVQHMSRDIKEMENRIKKLESR